jgi:protein-disulfide isomerase
MRDRPTINPQALRITGTPGFVAGDEVRTGATDFKGLQALISKGREAQQSVK